MTHAIDYRRLGCYRMDCLQYERCEGDFLEEHSSSALQVVPIHAFRRSGNRELRERLHNLSRLVGVAIFVENNCGICLIIHARSAPRFRQGSHSATNQVACRLGSIEVVEIHASINIIDKILIIGLFHLTKYLKSLFVEIFNRRFYHLAHPFIVGQPTQMI